MSRDPFTAQNAKTGTGSDPIAADHEAVMAVLSGTLATLVEADEGELYLVPSTDGSVRLHLRGRFSGCPGTSLVERRVIAPLVNQVLPEMAVEVTWGWVLPEGATRVSGSG